MRDVIIKIVIIIACLTNVAACDSEWWNDGFSPADHFFRNRFALKYSGTADFHKEDDGIFYVRIESFNEPLTKIRLKVTLPPEVKLLEGNLQWKGDLSSRSEKSLRLKVYSKKDMRDWSSPLAMYVEFLYKGEKIIGLQNSSYECKQKGCPTIWTKNGKKIDSIENIDKDEWLSDQKQENKL